VERQPVSSSNIRSIGYDPAALVLEVEFLNASIYQYFEVPESVHRAFMSAHSHGSFLQAHIRGKYRYRRIL